MMRNVLRLAFIPLEMTQLIPEIRQPVIYVSNHASYLDFIVLMAILPLGTAFVAKAELLESAFVRFYIHKLGHASVNRLDFTESISDSKSLATIVQQYSLMIFPEGTFTYATGLRPFKLGAFKIAVEAGVALCPIALQGTRKILRSNEFLLRPGRIKIHFSNLMKPQNKTWDEVIRLRNEIHKEIAAHCGEPTLDLIRAGYEKTHSKNSTSHR